MAPWWCRRVTEGNPPPPPHPRPQTCKEIEDTTWVCGVMALALAARLVGVLFREVGGFGDPEPAPFGILGYGLASMMVCRYRAWSSFSRSNRPLHVFRSSVLLETALVGAGIWSVVWPVNSDPTLLLCVYGTVGWWTCGALPPFPRMATYLVLYLVNIVLEYHRPLGLRHAVFHGPVLIGYTIYLAEQRGRIAFVVQRLLWLTQSDRTTAAVCAGERPRAAEV